MIRLIATIAVALAGVRWMRRGPYRLRSSRELAAVGYNYSKLMALSAVFGVALSGVAAGFAWAVASRDSAVLVGVATVVWLVQVTPSVFEAMLLASYRKRRNVAALFFLRRLRLQLASGKSLTAAAQLAAQRETDPAFEPVRAAVHAALASRGDALETIARALAGSPVEVMLGTATVAERTGTAAGRDLDELIDRAVAALESERRVGIDKLGRQVNTYGTVASLLPIAPITLSLVTTIT